MAIQTLTEQILELRRDRNISNFWSGQVSPRPNSAVSWHSED